MAERKEYIEIDNLPSSLMVKGWVLILFSGMILTVLLMSMKTNEIIPGTAVIKNNYDPLELHSLVSGSLIVQVQNNNLINKNQLIGYVEGNYSIKDVLELEKWRNQVQLDSFTYQYEKINTDLNTFKKLNVGIIKQDVLHLAKAVSEYSYLDKPKRAILNQLADNKESQIKNIQSEIQSRNIAQLLLDYRNNLDSTTLDRERQLLDEYLISAQEYEESEKKRIDNDYLRQVEQLKATDLYNQINKLDDEILTETGQFHGEITKTLIDVYNGYAELSLAIDNFIHQNFIRSPIDGTISLVFPDPQLQILEGEKVATIIPIQKAENYFGIVEVAERGFAKIKIGNEVRIKLDAYPYLEYGALVGEVEEVSSIAENQMYQVRIRFPEGMVSNYSRSIDYIQNMHGQAEILVKKSNLWESLINVFRWTKVQLEN